MHYCSFDAAHLALAPGLVGGQQQVRPSRLSPVTSTSLNAVAKTASLLVNCLAKHLVRSHHIIALCCHLNTDNGRGFDQGGPMSEVVCILSHPKMTPLHSNMDDVHLRFATVLATEKLVAPLNFRRY